MTSDSKNYRIFDWRWLSGETMDPIPLLRTLVSHLGNKADAVFRQMELELRLAERAGLLLDAVRAEGHQNADLWTLQSAWTLLGYQVGDEPFADLVCEHDFKEAVLPAVKTFSTEKGYGWQWGLDLAKHLEDSLNKDVKLRALQFIETTETLTTDPDHPRWEGGLLVDRDRWYSEAAIDMGVEIQQTTIASAAAKHVIKVENDSTKPVKFTRLDGKSSVMINAGYNGGLTELQIHDSGWKMELVPPDPQPPIKPV